MIWEMEPTLASWEWRWHYQSINQHTPSVYKDSLERMHRDSWLFQLGYRAAVYKGSDPTSPWLHPPHASVSTMLLLTGMWRSEEDELMLDWPLFLCSAKFIRKYGKSLRHVPSSLNLTLKLWVIFTITLRTEELLQPRRSEKAAPALGWGWHEGIQKKQLEC
jgi:hypothetical protein